MNISDVQINITDVLINISEKSVDGVCTFVSEISA